MDKKTKEYILTVKNVAEAAHAKAARADNNNQAIKQIGEFLIKINKRIQKSLEALSEQDMTDQIKSRLIKDAYNEWSKKMNRIIDIMKECTPEESAAFNLNAYKEFEGSLRIIAEKVMVVSC